MSDPTGVATGVAAVKAAAEVTRIILDSFKSPKPDVNAIREHVLQLHEHITNAKSGLSDAKEKISELQAALRKVEDVKQFESELTFDGVYWHTKNDGSRDPYPYCPRCWDVLKNRVRLKSFNDQYVCPEDENFYHTDQQRRRAEGQYKSMFE